MFQPDSRSCFVLFCNGPSSRLSATSPCLRNGLVDIGKRDVFYGEDDVAGLMFSEEELEQDTVM